MLRRRIKRVCVYLFFSYNHHAGGTCSFCDSLPCNDDCSVCLFHSMIKTDKNQHVFTHICGCLLVQNCLCMLGSVEKSECKALQNGGKDGRKIQSYFFTVKGRKAGIEKPCYDSAHGRHRDDRLADFVQGKS